MKIGFDVSQTGQTKTGCGYSADNLILELAKIDRENHYLLYPTFGDHYWDPHFKKTRSFSLYNFKRGLTHSSLKEAKRFWQLAPTELEKQLGHVEILHVNNFFCPPTLQNTKIIYTLHDLSFLETPDYHTEHNRIACFNGVFQASLNADLIMAVSNYTRHHFLKIFPHYPKERIITVYHGCRFDKTTQPLKTPRLAPLIPQQFWLNVGTIEPRKNPIRLLNAYAKLVRTGATSFPLIFAGKMGWLTENINDIISELGLTEYVHVLGYVENNELAWLYKNSFCMVYPSLFEGFGLPILEAMSYGLPVITANTSAIPEVIGEAGIIINPYDEEELYQAMSTMVTQHTLREEFKQLSITQASQFSWEKTARQVIELYNNINVLSKFNPSKG